MAVCITADGVQWSCPEVEQHQAEGRGGAESFPETAGAGARDFLWESASDWGPPELHTGTGERGWIPTWYSTPCQLQRVYMYRDELGKRQIYQVTKWTHYSILHCTPSFYLSLISLIVSVDVKHHVYLLTLAFCEQSPDWAPGTRKQRRLKWWERSFKVTDLLHVVMCLWGMCYGSWLNLWILRFFSLLEYWYERS